MVYYGDEKDIAPAIEVLGRDAIATLRVLAELAPHSGDAGAHCWYPDDLREIADRLEKK